MLRVRDYPLMLSRILYTIHCCVQIAQVRTCRSLTPPVRRVRERADEQRDVVMFGRILNCERDLNERVERLPVRPLEILLGLEHDLVGPRFERCG